MKFEALALVLLAGVNSCIGNLALKYSRTLAAPDAGFIEKMLNIYFVGGMAFYAINVLLFAKALDSAPVSIAYPILASASFAILAVSSAIFFREPMGWQQILGLLLLIAGIGLLVRAG
jgi:multidrug transporter EmrE-like cation transporter